LLKGCRVVFDELVQTTRQIEFLTDPGAGQLHIGCTEAGAASFVPAVITRILQKHPRVTFRVTTGDAATFLERHLPEREIDLAIGAKPESLTSHHDINSEVLFKDRYLVMASARSKWARKRNIRLKDLIEEPWILPPADTTMGMHIAQAFHANGIDPPRARVMSFSVPLSQNLLATGDFITVLPVMMTRLGGHLNLSPLNVRFPEISRAIVIMTLKNRTLSALADLFISSARDMGQDVTEKKRSRVPRM
jgi:DNA-binding transcriptional LysR family regulator